LVSGGLKQNGVRDLVRKVATGDKRSLGKALSVLESGNRADALELIRAIYPGTGGAFVIGITGSPGTGKSTLTLQLAIHLREKGQRVGIIAVDPSSPFSGGAILGDRIRMQALANDPGIFIRSMATRGQMGGLASATEDAILAFDTAGYDKVLVETVGVGQDEVDIARAAHLTLVLLVPGMGDDIQSIKAGVMEIADAFVINKADLPGAKKTKLEIESMLALFSPSSQSSIPIIETVALEGKGIQELSEVLENLQEKISETVQKSKFEDSQARRRVFRLLEEKILESILSRIPSDILEDKLHLVSQRKIDPVTLSEELLEEFL
jgi:LAO/AO transport system kinase